MCHYVEIRIKALLALGSMAYLVHDTDPSLSTDIVQLLIDSLTNDGHTNDRQWAPPRGPTLYRVLVDSIGNTRSTDSLSLLHDRARVWSSLSDAHSVIRALRHHHDQQVSSDYHVCAYVRVLTTNFK